MYIYLGIECTDMSKVKITPTKLFLGVEAREMYDFSMILCNYFTRKIEGPIINCSLKGTFCLLSVPPLSI